MARVTERRHHLRERLAQPEARALGARHRQMVVTEDEEGERTEEKEESGRNEGGRAPPSPVNGQRAQRGTIPRGSAPMSGSAPVTNGATNITPAIAPR